MVVHYWIIFSKYNKALILIFNVNYKHGRDTQEKLY